jgi:hypothetical protein
VTSEQALDAHMEWDMRDVFKRTGVPLDKLWWDAMTAIWSQLGKMYGVDVMWSAATGEPLPSGYIYHPTKQFKKDCRKFLTEMGCKLP